MVRGPSSEQFDAERVSKQAATEEEVQETMDDNMDIFKNIYIFSKRYIIGNRPHVDFTTFAKRYVKLITITLYWKKWK
jgi:hypothetical protein